MFKNTALRALTVFWNPRALVLCTEMEIPVALRACTSLFGWLHRKDLWWAYLMFTVKTLLRHHPKFVKDALRLWPLRCETKVDFLKEKPFLLVFVSYPWLSGIKGLRCSWATRAWIPTGRKKVREGDRGSACSALSSWFGSPAFNDSPPKAAICSSWFYT